jgi:hypothetical protein
MLTFRTMQQTVRTCAQHLRSSEHKTGNCSAITSTYDGFMTSNERTIAKIRKASSNMKP